MDDLPERIITPTPATADSLPKAKRRLHWRSISNNRTHASDLPSARSSRSFEDQGKRPSKWSMGILNDSETDEVPGSILLLSKVSDHNEPLGLRNAPARTSASSLPSPYPGSRAGSIPLSRLSYEHGPPQKKKTPDGKIVLEPQPEESPNDPLNWQQWRRDCALLTLGFYCMLGGGMTPILAAGFNEVAATYDISVPQVALTTGLYMMGLGVGSVIASPTAILFGKRPVYLVAAIVFVLTSIWCALSPSYGSLVVARVFMGIAVSPVECLPSATVAEIFFLHERAYRLGIYTLLLLGGKNIVPLVSAAIIQSLGWRWVFYIVAIIVSFAGVMLFFFVPETFWDRTPRPHKHGQNRLTRLPSLSLFRTHSHAVESGGNGQSAEKPAAGEDGTLAERRAAKRHARFASDEETKTENTGAHAHFAAEENSSSEKAETLMAIQEATTGTTEPEEADSIHPNPSAPARVHMHQSSDNEPGYFAPYEAGSDPAMTAETSSITSPGWRQPSNIERGLPSPGNGYTKRYRHAPPKTFVQQLRPWSGRLRNDNWLRVAFRPFILFCYPSILWSTMVYSLSVGWLIVLSESVAYIFENRASYQFTPLQTGLVYISPFIGGVLGTAVAGKVSDIIVRYISRRNGGIYEPEFRLVMALPVMVFTSIGLMGYGWSAQERDNWIVPTIFFGFISFGCSLGSTTAITFAVDSYRQYAGEALVTLNFSKNILHGLVFSLFFNKWLKADGAKDVFVAIGGIQVACLLLTIPMYIYGKRARMWTVRRNLMEKF